MHIPKEFCHRHLRRRPHTYVMRHRRHSVSTGTTKEQEDDFKSRQFDLQRALHEHCLQSHQLKKKEKKNLTIQNNERAKNDFYRIRSNF